MNAFLEGLLPYLAALYLFDGLVRIWPSEVLFYSLGGRTFRVAASGFRLALLSPKCEAFSVPAIPTFVGTGFISYTPRAVPVTSPLPEAFQEEPIEGAEPFSWDDRNVCRGRRALFPAGSPEVARQWALLLEGLRAAPADSRAKVRSRWMEESFDVPGLHGALSCYRKASAVGRLAGWVLLALLFVLLPLSLYSPLGRIVRPVWVLAPVAVAWGASVRGLLAFLKESGLDRPARVLAFLHFVFLPVSAARAWAVSARLLVMKFDFLTVAAALLDRTAFATSARRELARLRSLSAACSSGTVREAVAEREHHVLCLVQAVLGTRQLPLPAQQDDAASSFCPLCQVEFREGVPSCGDCGVPLESFLPGSPDGGSHSHRTSEEV